MIYKKIAKLALVLSVSASSAMVFAPSESFAASTGASTGQVFWKSIIVKLVQSPTFQKSAQVKTSNAPTQPKAEETQPETETPETNEEQAPNTNDEQAGSVGQAIIETGEKYMGTPYEFGARSGQTNTFDCSSFVQYVYKQHGIDLPRNSRQQSTEGTTVSKSEMQVGDLMFFTTSSSGSRIAHVGIYAGDNKILHTWGPGGVRYDSLSDGWLERGFVKAKRVIK